MQIFLIRRDEYFDRSGIYGSEGRDYDDNAERFIFFSKAVLELARRVTPPPEILHVHDWQTALVPVLVKERGLPFKTVLTIHNLAYQGSFWGLDFGLTNLPGDYFTEKGVEFYGNLNLLKGGMLFADQITTVSERYAREIQTPEYGYGLDPVARAVLGKTDRNPKWRERLGLESRDRSTHRRRHFRRRNSPGRSSAAPRCSRNCGLDSSPTGPVFAMVSRLAEQKGIDLLLPILDRLLADDVRLVILGQGDTSYERELMVAAKRHAGRFAFLKILDDRLAHLIEAGADISLIPSHFEPCGLTAMYALKYGTVPLARATGGLYEIVQDHEPGSQTGNGFLFFDYTAEAFYDAITRTKRVFRNSTEWSEIMQRAMAADFTWSKAAARYETIYERALGRK